MSKKLTPWFPHAVKPAMAGNYQLGRNGTALYFPFHYFDGEKWLYQASSSPSPAVNRYELDIERVYGNGIQWRGLAKKP